MSLTGIRVLLVDDEPDLLELHGLVLSGLGAISSKAANGKEALELLQTGTFDCILTDMRMPECTGIELLRAIRGLGPGYPPVFLITGDLAVTEQEIQALGGSGIFRKPLDLPAAAESIRLALLNQVKVT